MHVLAMRMVKVLVAVLLATCTACMLPLGAIRGDDAAAKGDYSKAAANYEDVLKRYGGEEYTPDYVLRHRAAATSGLAKQQLTKGRQLLAAGDARGALEAFYGVHQARGWGNSKLDDEALSGMGDVAKVVFGRFDQALKTGRFGAAIDEVEWLAAQFVDAPRLGSPPVADEAGSSKEHSIQSRLAKAEARAAAWLKTQAASAANQKAWGAALLECKLAARYGGDCGPLLAQATEEVRKLTALNWQISTGPECPDAAHLADRFPSAGRPFPIKVNVRCDVSSTPQRAEIGTYAENVEVRTTAMERVCTRTCSLEEKYVTAGTNLYSDGQYHTGGDTKCLAQETTCVWQPVTTNFTEKHLSKRPEQHVTWTFSAAGSYHFALGSLTKEGSLEGKSVVEDIAWDMPEFRDHYVSDATTQDGRPMEEKWYFRPAEKHVLSIDSASARESLRSPLLDDLALQIRTSANDFLGQPGALRPELNFGGAGIAGDGRSAQARRIDEQALDALDRLALLHAATGVYPASAAAQLDTMFALSQAEVDGALKAQRPALAHLEPLKLPPSDAESDTHATMQNWSALSGTQMLTAGIVELSAGARRSIVAPLEHPAFETYVRMDARLGGWFRLIGEATSSQLGGKSNGFLAAVGGSWPLFRPYQNLPVVMGISLMVATDRSVSDPANIYVNASTLVSLDLPASRWATITVDFAPNLLATASCSSTQIQQEAAQGGLWNSICSPGAKILHPLTGSLTVNPTQRFFLRGTVAHDFGATSPPRFGGELGARF